MPFVVKCPGKASNVLYFYLKLPPQNSTLPSLWCYNDVLSLKVLSFN